LKSFLERLIGGEAGPERSTASPLASGSGIARPPVEDTSQMASQDFDPITRSGPGDSSGSPTVETTPPPAASGAEYSRTSAMSRLEEALTKKALIWCGMLEDPTTDAKTQIEMFKLASEHLTRLRKSGGDGGEKPDLPGIDALRELMGATAKQAIHDEFDGLIDEHKVLTLPAFRPQGGRPSPKEIERRKRLAEAGLKHAPPSVVKKASSRATGGDDSDLARLLNKANK